jgi:hypothetical protein
MITGEVVVDGRGHPLHRVRVEAFSFTRKATQSIGWGRRRLGPGHRRERRRECGKPEPGSAGQRHLRYQGHDRSAASPAALIAMLIFIKYPLNDEKFKPIRDETEARKLAAIEAHHEKLKDVIPPDYKV